MDLKTLNERVHVHKVWYFEISVSAPKPWGFLGKCAWQMGIQLVLPGSLTTGYHTLSRSAAGEILPHFYVKPASARWKLTILKPKLLATRSCCHKFWADVYISILLSLHIKPAYKTCPVCSPASNIHAIFLIALHSKSQWKTQKFSIVWLCICIYWTRIRTQTINFGPFSYE